MKQNRLHDNDYPANNWNRNEKRSAALSIALAQRECEWEWNWNCLRHFSAISLHSVAIECVCVCVCWLSAFKNLGQSSEHKQNLDDDGYLTMLNNKWVDTHTDTDTNTYAYSYAVRKLGHMWIQVIHTCVCVRVFECVSGWLVRECKSGCGCCEITSVIVTERKKEGAGSMRERERERKSKSVGAGA